MVITTHTAATKTAPNRARIIRVGLVAPDWNSKYLRRGGRVVEVLERNRHASTTAVDDKAHANGTDKICDPRIPRATSSARLVLCGDAMLE